MCRIYIDKNGITLHRSDKIRLYIYTEKRVYKLMIMSISYYFVKKIAVRLKVAYSLRCRFGEYRTPKCGDISFYTPRKCRTSQSKYISYILYINTF